MCDRNKHDILDEIKHRLSCEVLSRFTLPAIRAHALRNLARWKAQGTWGPAYDQWITIIETNDDSILILSMTGLDQESNRLRQSIPYVGMLDQSSVKEIKSMVLTKQKPNKN
jgi:hypothetical protein